MKNKNFAYQNDQKTWSEIKIFFIFTILLIFSAMSVFAKDITISVNQSEYYFLVGEQASIPFDIDNSYDKQIDGMLTYTITQESNQGGLHYSSSNTQSKSISIPAGNQIIGINFGSSDSPTDLKADLKYSYTESDPRVVNMNQIIIHFVSDDSQKKSNNQQQKQSSQKEQSQQNQQSSQNSLQQQMQQMQEEMNKMMNGEPQQPSTQQKLQNNQMAQDSSALKQQMQNQMQEQQKLKEEFQKNLAQNQEFQNMHQELLQQGYNLTGGDLNPTTNNTGDFEINYQKDRESATLKGSMEDGNLTSIQKSSSEDSKKLMDILAKNDQFARYDSQLKKEGFTAEQPKIEQDRNLSRVEVPYQNQKNETASIKAIIDKNEVKNVMLEKEGAQWYRWLIVFSILLIIGIIIYRKYKNMKKKFNLSQKKEIIEKPIDIRKEAMKILAESKKLFEDGLEKDAYGKAAEALRFYYSYKLNMKTEMTNSDLIKALRKNKIDYGKTQKCLGLCGLVEFAKYKANAKDFDEIIALAETIII